MRRAKAAFWGRLGHAPLLLALLPRLLCQRNGGNYDLKSAGAFSAVCAFGKSP